jgi:hypothetical protein
MRWINCLLLAVAVCLSTTGCSSDEEETYMPDNPAPPLPADAVKGQGGEGDAAPKPESDE